MTTINPTITKVAAGTSSAAQQALQGGSKSGVLANAVGAGNFWDMILSGLTSGNSLSDAASASTASAAGDGAKDDSSGTAIATAAPKKENPLAMLQVALAAQTVDANGNIIVSNPAQSTDSLQTQLELTNQVINHLKNMLPETSDKDGIMNKLLAKLQTKSDTLQASLSALQAGTAATITKDTPVEDIPMPMLVALGLNPSEISQVTQRIQSLEKKLGRDITVEDLIAGVGNIIPPAQDNTAVATLGFAPAQPQQQDTAPKKSDDVMLTAIDQKTSPSGDLAAQLAALADAQDDADAGDTAPGTFGISTGKKSKGIPAPDLADVQKNPNVTDTDVKKAFNNFKDHIAAMINTEKSQTGDMTFPVSSLNGDLDSTFLQIPGVQSTSALTLGTTAQAANASVAQSSAGQPHPAAQIVAATITKAGKDGVDDTVNLRLDPPELGAVNVRLQFGKDKSVKAHITVEKPETYMMLQRDGATLERALQSAGLDANNSSISFELSQNNTFGHDNSGQGGGEKNFGGGNSNSQDADVEIVQSSVNWSVDPSTGHIRYNLFA